jgi:DNA-binding PadR family transcriptional regulator
MKYLTRKEELVLLTICKLEEDAYLVNIRKYLNTHTAKKWSVGNVYVPLDRMSKLGYLECYIGDPLTKRGGKAIKYYKITKHGLEALAEVKKVHDEMWAGLDVLAFQK